MGVLIFIAAVAGVIGAILGQVSDREATADLNEQIVAQDEINKAAEEVADAQYQRDKEEALRTAEGYERQAAEITRRAEVQNKMAIGQLESVYGTEGEMGTIWHQYTKKLLEDVSSQGQFEAAAGASGLKRSGTIAQMGQIQKQNLTEAEQIAKKQIQTQQAGQIGQVSEDWKAAGIQSQEAATAAAQIRSDWGAGSTLQNLYGARTRARAAGYEAQGVAQRQALEEVNPESWWNIGSHFLQGANAGLSIGTGFSSIFPSSWGSNVNTPNYIPPV